VTPSPVGGFATLPIPPTAYRRTWLAGQLEGLEYGQAFLRLLKTLAPRKAVRLSALRPLDCARALMWHVSTLFPIREADYETLNDVLHWGIPVEPLGYHPDHGSPAYDLAALDLSHYFMEKPADCPGFLEVSGLADWMATWWPGRVIGESESFDSARLRPPRGRALRGAWAGLPDLADYVTSGTGNLWLDYNEEDTSEMQMPPWDVDEIRSLAHEWRRARPIYARIVALANYVDAAPRERLPILDKALRGDRETRFAITERRHP
jgi:hypothetical protein